MSQIIDKQTNIDINLFEEVFGYDTPEKILQTLRSLKRGDSDNQEAFLIEDSVVRFGDRVKRMPNGAEKNKGKKILKIISKIPDFNLNEQKQRRQGLVTPSQMRSRLPISLAQLKAENNSKKLKNDIRQLLYSLCRSKYLEKISIKVWLTLFENGNNLYEH